MTPWTVACQAPLSMELSRQEYQSEYPFPSSGDLPDPWVKPRAPTRQADSFPSEPPGKPSCVSGQVLSSAVVHSFLLLFSCQVVSDCCNSMDCHTPGSSVHGILQARIQEWIAIPFFRGSSRPMDQPQVSCFAGRLVTV